MAFIGHRPLVSFTPLRSTKIRRADRVSRFSTRSNSVSISSFFSFFLVNLLVIFPNSCMVDCFLQVEAVELKASRKEYSPGMIDDVFLKVFRSKMVQVKQALPLASDSVIIEEMNNLLLGVLNYNEFLHLLRLLHL